MVNRPFSFLEPYLPKKQDLQRQRSAFSVNFRTNRLLKLVALISALFLYVFVQSERNPVGQKLFNVPVVAINGPEGLDYDLDTTSLPVNLTGAKSVLEGLKEGDIRAVGDMHEVKPDVVEPQVLHLKIKFTTLSDRAVSGLQIDPPAPLAHVKIFIPVTRRLPVTLSYPQKPPVGYRYGNPEVQPTMIKLSGRKERVSRVARLIVNAVPLGVAARIDGEFPILVRDGEDRPIEGVLLEPNAVRVVVPLVEEPPSKIVLVSPTISDLPLPPYILSDVRVVPNQVKMVGRPGRLNSIGMLKTEALSIKSLTQETTLTVNLNPAADVAVRDMEDRPITSVKVTIKITKQTEGAKPTNPGEAEPRPQNSNTNP
jgi:YbbR domain-containing protein